MEGNHVITDADGCRVCQGPIERTDDPGQDERTLCDWCEAEMETLMKECES